MFPSSYGLQETAFVNTKLSFLASGDNRLLFFFILIFVDCVSYLLIDLPLHDQQVLKA